MGALNLYIYLLLPVFVVWQAVSFTWRATVASAQFETVTEFLSAFIILVLGAAAWLSVYGVDRYAFFSNIVFLFAAGASRVIQTFFPTLLDGRGGAGLRRPPGGRRPGGAGGPVDLRRAHGLLLLPSGGGRRRGRELPVDLFGRGHGRDGRHGPVRRDGMAGMGMDGMMGGAQAAGNTSLIGKLVGLFVKTGEDFTLFANTVECGLFVLVCLFFLFYFFGNRKFFFSSLEDFRVRMRRAEKALGSGPAPAGPVPFFPAPLPPSAHILSMGAFPRFFGR